MLKLGPHAVTSLRGQTVRRRRLSRNLRLVLFSDSAQIQLLNRRHHKFRRLHVLELKMPDLRWHDFHVLPSMWRLKFIHSLIRNILRVMQHSIADHTRVLHNSRQLIF